MVYDEQWPWVHFILSLSFDSNVGRDFEGCNGSGTARGMKARWDARSPARKRVNGSLGFLCCAGEHFNARPRERNAVSDDVA